MVLAKTLPQYFMVMFQKLLIVKKEESLALPEMRKNKT